MQSQQSAATEAESANLGPLNEAAPKSSASQSVFVEPWNSQESDRIPADADAALKGAHVASPWSGEIVWQISFHTLEV